MNHADRIYLSKFSVDPTTGYDWEDLYDIQPSRSYDQELFSMANTPGLEVDDILLEDDFDLQP